MSSDNIIVNADGPGRIRGARPAARLVAAAALAVALLLLALLVVVVTSTSAADRRAFLIGLGVLVLCAGAVGVYYLLQRARRAQLVELPNGHPITIDQVARQPLEFAGMSLAQHYQAQLAEASRQYPTLTTLHQHHETNSTATAAAAALPAPAEAAAAAVPVEDWLAWADQVPHIILAAQTGDASTGQGGKTTTARAILASRIARGEAVFVIDPHSSGWFADLPSAGGGQNWAEVAQAIDAVAGEYFARMQARQQHLLQHQAELAHDHFPRLTVLLDEANETRKHLDIAERGKISPWAYFAEVLGSGARKVNISVMMIMQSANVEDLGLSLSYQRNFLRLALDQAVIKTMIEREEKDKQRRDALYAALVGRAFPAATVRGAQVVLLDRAGLDQRPRPSSAASSTWPGWSAYQAQLQAKQQAQLGAGQAAAPAAPSVAPAAAPATIGERVVAALQRSPGLRLGELAELLGMTDKTDRQVLQNELGRLRASGEVERRGSAGKFRYFAK